MGATRSTWWWTGAGQTDRLLGELTRGRTSRASRAVARRRSPARHTRHAAHTTQGGGGEVYVSQVCVTRGTILKVPVDSTPHSGLSLRTYYTYSFYTLIFHTRVCLKVVEFHRSHRSQLSSLSPTPISVSAGAPCVFSYTIYDIRAPWPGGVYAVACTLVLTTVCASTTHTYCTIVQRSSEGYSRGRLVL